MLRLQFDKRLGDFDLSVDIVTDSHGVLALFGRSGCGKTTLINLIAGLSTPDRGRCELDGEVLFDSAAGIHLPTEQRRIGYVFQDARLFPHYTVRGNLNYGRQRVARHTKRHSGRSEPRIGFDAVVELLDLAPLLERRAHHLSGGEQQRVALGRALLSQPRLLLLDEPLASLDQSRRNEVLPYLESVRDELAIPMVYVSHQFEEVLQLATHVALLNRGRVVAQGSLPDVSRAPALRDIVGAEAIGAVIESRVHEVDVAAGLAHVDVGHGQLHVDSNALRTGQPVRLHLLARDLILSLHAPVGLSVRNSLQGVITHVAEDGPHARLVNVDVGGVELIARVTRAAAEELQLREQLSLWVLVKAVTLRGHVFHTQDTH